MAGTQRDKQTDRGKKIDISNVVDREKGFTYIEYLISISVLLFILLFFATIFQLTNTEKEKNTNLLMLQHSYEIGYQYLKTEVIKGHSFSGGDNFPLFIYNTQNTQAFRQFGGRLIRSLKDGYSDFEGTIIVFNFIDELMIERLPNQRGIHLYGQLKMGNEVFSFDDILLSKYGGDVIANSP